MSTTTSQLPSGLHFFQREPNLASLWDGIVQLGISDLLLTLLLVVGVSAVISRVLVGHLFPRQASKPLILVIGLTSLLTLVPVLEAVGRGNYSFYRGHLGMMLFELSAELFFPAFLILVFGYGLFELLRYTFGVRLDPNVKRMLAALSFLFLFALAGPVMQRMTGEAVKNFIAKNLKDGSSE